MIEIWSPSTGRYDIREKLPDYQARGDKEICYVHPYERTIAVWGRSPDGRYVESVHRSGELRPESLPGVVFDVDVLSDSNWERCPTAGVLMSCQPVTASLALSSGSTSWAIRSITPNCSSCGASIKNSLIPASR